MQEKKSVVQRFVDFKMRNNLTSQKIVRMVNYYAHSPNDVAVSYICDHFQITKYVFYKSRDFAIMLGLIDKDVCQLIQAKAMHNYKEKNPYKTTTAVCNHFKKLYTERQLFLNSFTKDDILKMGQYLMENTSLEIIAKYFNTGIPAITTFIKVGYENLIFLGSLSKAIEKMMTPSSIEKRNRKKEELISYFHTMELAITKRIEVIKFNPFETEKLPSLYKELKIVQEMKQEALQL